METTLQTGGEDGINVGVFENYTRLGEEDVSRLETAVDFDSPFIKLPTTLETSVFLEIATAEKIHSKRVEKMHAELESHSLLPSAPKNIEYNVVKT